jgi:hypothetical protein
MIKGNVLYRVVPVDLHLYYFFTRNLHLGPVILHSAYKMAQQQRSGESSIRCTYTVSAIISF